jgi:ABC-type phosphate/phosphonate transport system ATPase subunit
MRKGRIVFDGAPDELGAEDQRALYDLSDEEMMADA